MRKCILKTCKYAEDLSAKMRYMVRIICAGLGGFVHGHGVHNMRGFGWVYVWNVRRMRWLEWEGACMVTVCFGGLVHLCSVKHCARVLWVVYLLHICLYLFYMFILILLVVYLLHGFLYLFWMVVYHQYIYKTTHIIIACVYTYKS